MKNSLKIEVTCNYCGKIENVNPSRAVKYKYCSRKCSGIGSLKEHNVNCAECGKSFRQRPDRLKRKRIFGFFCSNNCQGQFKKNVYKGEGNPNFKSTFKDNDGYPLQYIPQIGRIKEHLYVTLKYLNIQKIPKNYHIHHRDCNVFNNSPENLAVLTSSDHKFIHKNFGNACLWALQNNKIDVDTLCEWSREPIKSKTILETSLINQIAVFKQDELLETPEMDNQQPSLGSNTFEGSTTNRQVLPSNVEDSNSDTSVLPKVIEKDNKGNTLMPISFKILNFSDDIV